MANVGSKQTGVSELTWHGDSLTVGDLRNWVRELDRLRVPNEGELSIELPSLYEPAEDETAIIASWPIVEQAKRSLLGRR